VSLFQPGILLWLDITDFGRLADKFRWLAWVSTGIYLLLNLVFLALEGLTNPEQGGALRVALPYSCPSL
jgi:hypothetical protein